jgi:hypothetical protein
MLKNRMKALVIVAAVALVLSGAWLAHDVRERHKAAEREAYYQIVLSRFTTELNVGMTRREVESHLKTSGKSFSQMCCVAAHRGEHVNFVGSGWDDLVKIGQESAPWFCSKKNVYVAFEFNPKSEHELPDTNVSDILKRISLLHSLEGCM